MSDNERDSILDRIDELRAEYIQLHQRLEWLGEQQEDEPEACDLAGKSAADAAARVLAMFPGEALHYAAVACIASQQGYRSTADRFSREEYRSFEQSMYHNSQRFEYTGGGRYRLNLDYQPDNPMANRIRALALPHLPRIFHTRNVMARLNEPTPSAAQLTACYSALLKMAEAGEITLRERRYGSRPAAFERLD